MKSWKQDREPVNTGNTVAPPPERCVYCGHPAQLVWVHGHGQCANCGINTEECCRGETCNR